MATALALGGLIGLVLGLTGAGGGVLAVPALTLGLGLSMTAAAPISLIAVGAASALAALAALRAGLVRYRAALLMAALGIASAPCGVWLAHRLPQTVLVGLFCSLMLGVALRMALQVRARRRGQAEPVPRRCMLDPATGRFRWNLRCSATLAGIGAVAGLFTGMLGVGGGFLIVPAFRQFSDLSMQASSATSLAVIALVSSVTAAGTLVHGARIPPAGLAFILATGAGMLLGRRLAGRIEADWLQLGFALSVLAVALVWLAKTFAS